MNNNNNEKSSKTFRKEAIYVVLFVCLCIAATAAAVTSKNHKVAKQQAMNKEKVEAQKQAKKQEKPEITLVDDSLRDEKEHENSLEVKNNKHNKDMEENKVTTVTNSNEIKVSKNLNAKMIKPVQGKVVREYSEVPVYWDSTKTYRPNFGMDIQAKLGQEVLAVNDGVIAAVNKNKDGFGQQVIVDHQNGLKSVYANLSETISVKNGQKIKQGEKIGEVGNTSLRSSSEKYGSNLHFEILKDNENVNPSKYVKY